MWWEKIGFFDETVRPDALHQFFFRHQLTGVLD
jgi:hypothetical protein